MVSRCTFCTLYTTRISWNVLASVTIWFWTTELQLLEKTSLTSLSHTAIRTRWLFISVRPIRQFLVLLISDRYLRSNWYRYPISDHINNAILIARFLAISWHPEVRMISCNNNSYTNAQANMPSVGQTMQNGDNYLKAPNRRAARHWWSSV